MLTHFTRELERSKGELDYHQVWRYTKGGKLPKLFLWLAQHPKLAAALAKDARELASRPAISVDQVDGKEGG